MVFSIVTFRMQNTLMRLMKKKGLRRDPFQKLVTTAITPTEDSFTDSPTNLNPLSNKKLRPRNKGDFTGAVTPSTKQDSLLKPLKSRKSSEIFGQSPPPKKQNPLLRNLRGKNNQGQFEGQKAPSSKQDNLLKQLSPGHTGNVEGIDPPSTSPVKAFTLSKKNCY